MELWHIFLIIGGVVILQFVVMYFARKVSARMRALLDREEFVFRYQYNLFVICAIMFLMLGSGSILSLILIPPNANYIIFGCMGAITLGFLFLGYVFLRKRFRMKTDTFIRCKLFGKTEYAYSDIIRAEDIGNGRYEFTMSDGTRFKTGNVYVGYRQFRNRIAEKTGLIPPAETFTTDMTDMTDMTDVIDGIDGMDAPEIGGGDIQNIDQSGDGDAPKE